MSATALTITATFEDGVLHPDQPLPLAPRQRVTIVLELPAQTGAKPNNVAEPEDAEEWPIEQAALTEAIELDRPAPIEMPRRRLLTLLDPDAEIIGERE